ncbi:hypothetical protein IFM89_003461 [Coptis chinensis]|uniref:Splicing factor 3A subunit 1 n=1 Tax=Coptis chinensis TaxID=261450 RepID=A0A835LLB2_9MAGN|nr:hypothetical protein IFM89_003461 [Coptis chinensis]
MLNISSLPHANFPPVITSHTRRIGIIYPPPAIRAIVDKTAEYVSKKGPEFVKKIVNEGNAKFSFLTDASHHYNAYYQRRVSEFRLQAQQLVPTQPTEACVVATSTTTKNNESVASVPALVSQFRPECKEPEAQLYSVSLPEGIISGETFDVIKLTAQFIARNGKSFLAELSGKEIFNPQFSFLKPNNSMYTFFTKLTDAYSKVLMPPKGLTDKLRTSVADMTTVLDRCLNRCNWELLQEQKKQKAEKETEQERIQMGMIDWHDFCVVETIEFADFEDTELPQPLPLEEIIMRSKASSAMEEDMPEVIELEKEADMDTDEEEMQLVVEGMEVASLEEYSEVNKSVRKAETPKEPEPPVRIVKNWKRPEERVPIERGAAKFVLSPITGELIHINEMAEHMRISLIDPKYREQKRGMMAKIRETTLAQDDEISRNIMGLARTRPDIFGTTAEEVSNAVKAEIEKRKEEGPNVAQYPAPSSVYNALNSSVRPLLPLMPMNCGQPLHPSSTYMNHLPIPIPIPPPPGSQFTPLGGHRPFAPIPFPPPSMKIIPPSPLLQGIPPPPPDVAPPPLPDEPEPKRQRLDDSLLLPEDQFLAQNQGPVRIVVSVPNVSELNLKAQPLDIKVQDLSETVGSLKEKIAGEIQLPANKQKLTGRAGFLKDNFSLAYYNIGAGQTLALALRERGGRKR